MRDFVVYHNPEAMGVDVEAVDAFSIVTDKTSVDPYGIRIWLLSGRGKPRTFVLRSWFIVDSVEPGRGDGYKTKLSGKSGEVFEPVIDLNNEDWFQDFKRNQGNFAFGFNAINEDRFIKALETVAARAIGLKKPNSSLPPSHSIHVSQQQHTVRLVLNDGSQREAAATGNNAAWLCVCGRKLPLVGRTGHKGHSANAFRVICPDCSRQYHVVPEDKDLGRVFEVRER